MKSMEAITRFYDENLGELIERLENRRVGLRKKIVLFSRVLITVAVLVTLALMIVTDWSWFGILFSVAFISLALYGLAYNYLAKDFVLQYKEGIFRPVLQEIDSDLLYERESFVDEALLQNSQMFPKESVFKGNDLIKGRVLGVPMAFSDLEVRYTDRRDKESRTLFHGSFFVAQFNKKIESKTVLRPSEGRIEKMISALDLGPSDKISMDSPEFNKRFTVLSDNTVEAHYILSHTMMERLIGLLDQVKYGMEVVFYENYLFIAITAPDRFEPTLFDSLSDSEKIRDFFKPLFLLLGIVEELKLNEKLWSKE